MSYQEDLSKPEWEEKRRQQARKNELVQGKNPLWTDLYEDLK